MSTPQKIFLKKIKNCTKKYFLSTFIIFYTGFQHFAAFKAIVAEDKKGAKDCKAAANEDNHAHPILHHKRLNGLGGVELDKVKQNAHNEKRKAV